ncbi:helix-turn-helix domain-containing protein [Pseudonocardia hierapolitana]|uniref:helix-turn-helix domain-containing protein n=1 Tax=Pseudonocardia hierapolitana TaxID=1128676 RepID=UPI00319EB6A4
MALHRGCRGLGQAAVAGLVGRSESWLSQVERGRPPRGGRQPPLDGLRRHRRGTSVVRRAVRARSAAA